MPILVTGGTGHVGGEVVRQLARARIKVRAMVRDLSKASSIRGEGVEIIRGDLSEPETLDAALWGMGVVLLSSPAEPNMVELQTNMIDAAKRAGVRHLVKISAMGADANSPAMLTRWHAQIEQHLAASGVSFTNLRPNFFMQNMLNFAPMIAKQGVFRGAMGDGKASFVDVRDIAAVAVAVITGENHRGESLTITGPEAISFADVAQKLSAATARKIEYVDIPSDALIRGMMAAGMPEWFARDMATLQDVFGKGHGALVTDTVQRVGKKTPTPFDEFARDFAPIFRGERMVRRFAACL